MASHNFHLPLPHHLYTLLKQEAKTTQKPITHIVLNAIEEWHKNKEREKTEEELHIFVQNYKTTKDDLDLISDFENASIESLQNHE